MRVRIREAEIGHSAGGVLINNPDEGKTIVFDPATTPRERCALMAEFLSDEEFSQFYPALSA